MLRRLTIMYTTKEMFDLEHTLARDYLLQFEFPWDALPGIKDLLLNLVLN